MKGAPDLSGFARKVRVTSRPGPRFVGVRALRRTCLLVLLSAVAACSAARPVRDAGPTTRTGRLGVPADFGGLRVTVGGFAVQRLADITGTPTPMLVATGVALPATTVDALAAALRAKR